MVIGNKDCISELLASPGLRAVGLLTINGNESVPSGARPLTDSLLHDVAFDIKAGHENPMMKPITAEGHGFTKLTQGLS